MSIDSWPSMGECHWFPLLSRLLIAAASGFGELTNLFHISTAIFVAVNCRAIQYSLIELALSYIACICHICTVMGKFSVSPSSVHMCPIDLLIQICPHRSCQMVLCWQIIEFISRKPLCSVVQYVFFFQNATFQTEQSVFISISKDLES